MNHNPPPTQQRRLQSPPGERATERVIYAARGAACLFQTVIVVRRLAFGLLQ
jgi:hypothetical protein